MNDRYTKAVLTIIAAALVVLAMRGIVPGASAQSGVVTVLGTLALTTSGRDFLAVHVE